MLSAFIGGVVGYHYSKRKQRTQTSLSKDYFIGLNYLLNEQPDQAVDVFIKMLEVNDNTVETHLAMGSVFRRRGETDRAIKIHQNIIARANLSKELRIQALVELGRDYMLAGVYDRAERLFLEAIEAGSKFRQQAMQYLLDIYEHEKDWQQAINIAKQLHVDVPNLNMGNIIAQYYCEFIQDPRTHFTEENINNYLTSAHTADEKCLRLHLIIAKREYEKGNFVQAIALYKQLIKQEPSFIAEILPILEKAYEKQNDESGLVEYLYKSIQGVPHPVLIIALAEKLEKLRGLPAAIEFLIEQLRVTPSLAGVEYLTSLQAKLVEDTVAENFTTVKNFLYELRHQKPHYQCEHCGYLAKKLIWRCPSCHRWSTIKPHYESAIPAKTSENCFIVI